MIKNIREKCPVIPVYITMKDNKKNPESFSVKHPSNGEKWFSLAPNDAYILNYKHKGLGISTPNALHIGIKGRFIVIDSDKKETSEIIDKIINEKQIKIYKTPSFSTAQNKELAKYHYYIPYSNNFKDIKKMVEDEILKVDIITDNIIEPIENLIILNEMSRDYKYNISNQHFKDILIGLSKAISEGKYDEIKSKKAINKLNKIMANIQETNTKIILEEEQEQEQEQEDPKLNLLRQKIINDTSILKRLLKNIPDNETYDNWLKVMFSIADLCNNNDTSTKDKLFFIFDEWSKGAQNYDYNKNKEQFINVKPITGQPKITVRTLLHLSRENNEIEHKKILTKYSLIKLDNQKVENGNVKEALEKITLSHSNIANFIYNRNPNKYIFRKSLNKNEHGTYYFFKEYEGNYIIEGSANTPSQGLTFVMDELEEFKKYANEQITSISDDIEAKQLQALRLKYSNNTVVFGNLDFSAKILKLLAEKYETNDKIEELIDASPFLIPFNNCVYDFRIKQFRKIKKDDYIKTRISYNIDTELIEGKKKLENYDYKGIYDFIYSIFEDDEKVKYILMVNASKLITGYEYAYFNLGCGGNGKGLLDYLLEQALGPLHYNAPSNFLSARANAEIDTSLTAIPRCVRNIVVKEVVEEQQNKEGIDSEIYKSLTGEKSVIRRTIHSKEMIEIPINFTIDIQSNYNPQIKPDNGVKRRTRLIRYLLDFVENPKLPNERKINLSMKDNIDAQFSKLFMLNLIMEANKLFNYDEQTGKITRAKIDEPADFLREKEVYFNSNDELQQFLDETIETTNNNADKIALSAITQAFNTFFNKEGRLKWSSRKLADELARKKYERVKDSVNKIRGIKWRDNGDE